MKGQKKNKKTKNKNSSRKDHT